MLAKSKQNRFLIILTLIWLVVISCLGFWWLYLLIQFGKHIPDETLSALPSLAKIMTMVKWEGTTFIVLLVFITVTIFFLYLQNVRKAMALQDFFASLTHELKSPLASIKLNAEVMNEIKDSDPKSLSLYLERILQDSKRLEEDLDNILQLSRIERGGILNPAEINIVKYMQQFAQKDYPNIDLKINCDSECEILLIDELALRLILRNLFDNTVKHSSDTAAVSVSLKKQQNKIEFIYHDQNSDFTGDAKQLGKLFYKHNSPQGSGIGLYLIKKLLRAMNGDMIIDANNGLAFNLLIGNQEVS